MLGNGAGLTKAITSPAHTRHCPQQPFLPPQQSCHVQGSREAGRAAERGRRHGSTHALRICFLELRVGFAS